MGIDNNSTGIHCLATHSTAVPLVRAISAYLPVVLLATYYVFSMGPLFSGGRLILIHQQCAILFDR